VNRLLAHDMLMNKGRDKLILALTDPGTIPTLTQIRVGTGTRDGGTVPTMTELVEELAQASITMKIAKSTQAKLAAVFKSTEAVGTWTEAGLFDSAGNMWTRVEFSTPIEKSSGEVKCLYWYVAFAI